MTEADRLTMRFADYRRQAKHIVEIGDGPDLRSHGYSMADRIVISLQSAYFDGLDDTKGDRPDALREALRVHHPIMRSETGPLSGCRCGAVKLGQDVIAHVVTELRAALDAERHHAVAAVARARELAKDLHTDARSMWSAAEAHESETDEMVGDTYFETSKRIRAALDGDQ